MIMYIAVAFLLIIILVPVFAMIATNLGPAAIEQERWELKNELENEELEKIIIAQKKKREKEELFWFILANLRLNEHSLNELKIKNPMIDGFEKVRIRNYFDEQFHLKARNIIITFYEIENVDKLSEYNVDEHFELKREFNMQWMYKINIGAIADLDFLKEKILIVQPGRKTELEKLIKKEKLKTIFIK